MNQIPAFVRRHSKPVRPAQPVPPAPVRVTAVVRLADSSIRVVRVAVAAETAVADLLVKASVAVALRISDASFRIEQISIEAPKIQSLLATALAKSPTPKTPIKEATR